MKTIRIKQGDKYVFPYLDAKRLLIDRGYRQTDQDVFILDGGYGGAQFYFEADCNIYAVLINLSDKEKKSVEFKSEIDVKNKRATWYLSVIDENGESDYMQVMEFFVLQGRPPYCDIEGMCCYCGNWTSNYTISTPPDLKERTWECSSCQSCAINYLHANWYEILEEIKKNILGEPKFK